MSDANESELDRFLSRDQMMPHVTASAVADSLKHFPPQCRYSMDWLATAVRRAFAFTIRSASDAPDRPSNRDAKLELKKLAARAGKAWLTIQERSGPADSAVFDHAWHNSPSETETDIGDGIVIGNPVDYSRFSAALAELDWLSSFLRDAANNLERQAARWREAEMREINVQRAQCLMPIFQTAFGLNNLTGFGDFYPRMAWLAFSQADIPDFEALISDARQRHSREPAYLNHIIPAPY